MHESHSALWAPVVRLTALFVAFLRLGPLHAQSDYSAPYNFTTLAGMSASGSTDGTGSGARFNQPGNLAVDQSGNVYVADTNNHTIRKITPTGVVTTLAGQASVSGSVDGDGNAARFYSPKGVAVGGDGTVFVADSSNHTVRKISPAGIVTTLAGTAGSPGSADGAGSAAQFNGLTGVAVDNLGRVFVADFNSRTVRQITPLGVVTTLAGLAGNSGSADGTGGAARFAGPLSVVVNNSGDVFVADFGNHTIRQVTTGGVVTTLAGLAGSPGSADGTGNVARFNGPKGVGVDNNGNVLAADTGNHTIRRITPAGVVTTLAGMAGVPGGADGTESTARFNGPKGVAGGLDGSVYIADTGNNTIRRGIPATGQAPQVISASTASATVNSAFSYAIIVSNTASLYTATGLPAGLSLNSGTGAITGTPTVVGVSVIVLTATNAVGTSPAFTLTITVAASASAPVITTQPASQTVDVGQSATFSVVATGTPALNYQWRKNGSAISGATGATLSLSAVQLSHAGTYDVVVANLAGTVTSSEAVLTVSDPSNAPAFSVQPIAQTVQRGQMATFRVVVTGTPAPTLQWRKDGVAIAGATAATLMLTNLQPANAGIYTLVATNANGSTTSAVASLTVTEPLPVRFSYRDVLEGKTRTLSANLTSKDKATGQVSVNGVESAQVSGPFRFDWGDGTSNTTWFPGAHTFTDTSRNYAIKVTAYYSNGTTDEVTVPVIFLPFTVGNYTPDVAVRVTVPASVPSIQSTQAGYGVPSLIGFADAELPAGMGRDVLERVFSIANEIMRDLHNGDTEIVSGGGFPQVVLTQPTMTYGGFSLWYTDPPVLAVNKVMMLQDPVGWSVFFHELSHNVSLRSPAAYRTGGRTDGQANGVFTESMARIFPGVVAYLLVNDAARYGIPTELADQLALQARNDLRAIKANTVGPIALWDIPGGADEVMPAFNTIAYQFFLNADPDGKNYRDALKRMMSRLTCFNPAWHAAYDSHTNSVSGARFRAAMMIGSMSYGLQKDLRNTFRDLGFPIDDLYYTAVYNGQRDLTHIITSATDLKAASGYTFNHQIAASGNPTAYAVQGLPAGLTCAAATGVIAGTTTQKGSYLLKVTASSAAGSSEVEARLVVGDLAISTQPLSQTVALGQNATFTVGAVGTAPLSYQWRKGGTAVASATNATLTLMNVQIADAGNYDVVVSNSSDSLTSAVATLTVDAPLTITAQPASVAVATGQSATLSIAAVGPGTLTYQWRRNDAAIPGATNASYTVASTQLAQTGRYTVTVSSGTDGLTSQPAFLRLNGAARTVSAARTVVQFAVDTRGPWWTEASLPVRFAPVSGVNEANVAVEFPANTSGQAVDGTIAIGGYLYPITRPASSVGARELWAVGNDRLGQLGQAHQLSRLWPFRVMGGVTKVATGCNHSLVLDSEGTLWGLGWNSSGQLGDGTTTDRVTPVRVASGVVTMAGGLQHSLFVKTDGSLWTMGNNSIGQLGDGTTTSRWSPVQVATGGIGVTAMAAGDSHSLFLKSDGTLWAMGTNYAGQLGDGTTTSRSTPVNVASGVASISAGVSHSLFVKTDGSLWGMGTNTDGRLGDGTIVNRSAPVMIADGVAQVSAGYMHSAFVKTDGTLWTVGVNGSGQLGDGTTANRTSLLQVASGVRRVTAGWFHTLFIKTDGTMWGTGTGSDGRLGDGSSANRTTPAQVGTDLLEVDAGGAHSIFLKTDGTAWTSGSNETVQLVDGNPVYWNTPVYVDRGVTSAALSTNNTCNSFYLKTDGTLWAMGTNGNNNFGAGTSIGRRTVPVPVATGVATMVAGANHTLILKTDGSLWAAGRNGNGQLGDNTTVDKSTFFQVTTGVQSIAAGWTHSAFVKTDGTLWTMGLNTSGQLGDGTTGQKTMPTQVATGVASVAANDNHTAWVKADGTLWTVGANSYGQLGTGNTSNRTSPVQVATAVARAVAGEYFTIFRKTDGTVWGMGYNGFGQLGLGHTTNQSNPVQLLAGVSEIAAGDNHTLWLKTDGTLWAAGRNRAGQLGDGTEIDRTSPVRIAGGVAAIAAGWETSMFIMEDALVRTLLLPQIRQQPQSRTVASAVSVSLVVAAAGEGPLSYQWFKSGAPLPQEKSAVLTFGNVQATDAGSYTVVITNGAGSVTSGAALLTVSGATGVPTITSAPTAAATVGAAFAFTIIAGNSPTSFAATGLPAGLNLATATGIISGTPTTAGSYPVTLTAANASGPSPVFTLTIAVAALPVPIIATQPDAQAVLTGGSATFTVAATNPVAGALTYRWYFTPAGSATPQVLSDQTGKLAGTQTATLTVSAIQTSDTGDYVCVVGNSAGLATSNAAWLSSAARIVRVGSQTAAPGSQVVVPIQLLAAGDENTVTFGLQFNPAKLTYVGYAAGADVAGGTVTPNVSQKDNGQLGFLIGKAPDTVHGAGTRVLLTLTFTVAAGVAGDETVPLTFADQPINRRIFAATSAQLPGAFADGQVTAITGLEGDINGDGEVDGGDWVKLGRIVVGLDAAPASGVAFMRTDLAPRTTKGDGQLDGGDWVQLGRYVVGLDVLQPAGGPAAPSP